MMGYAYVLYIKAVDTLKPHMKIIRKNEVSLLPKFLLYNDGIHLCGKM